MPTQVYILSWPLNNYTLYVAITVITGCVWALWRVKSSWQAFSSTFNALLIGILFAFVWGRVGYVLLNLNYFEQHLNEIASTTSPGIWEQAAIIGGLFGWLIAGLLRQKTEAIDYIVLATLTGIGASGGCISAGCAYGREVFWTDGWLWSLRVDWPDAYLINNPRLPTQEFMIVWLLVCFIAVMVAQARGWQIARAGRSLLLWTLLFACGDFILQFTRADVVPSLGLLRLPQWADVTLALTSAVYLTLNLHKAHAK